MDEKLSAFNLVVTGLMSAGITFLLAISSMNGKPEILNLEKSKSTAWTLILWCVWWISLFLLYLYLKIDKSYSYQLILVLSDFGNLCTVGAAIAYCCGKEFSRKQLLPLSCILVLLILWDIALPSFVEKPDSPSAQGRILVIAPSAALSSLSIIALGWSIVIRCGWAAWPFLLLTAFYALGQLPAYFDVTVFPAAKETIGNLYRVAADSLKVEAAKQALDAQFGGLSIFFWYLGIGKVLYAIAFFGYFFSPEHALDDLKRPKYWPNEKIVKMHPQITSMFRWVIATLIASFLGALGAERVPGLVETLKFWFTKP